MESYAWETLLNRFLLLQEIMISLRSNEPEALLEKAKRGAGLVFPSTRLHMVDPDTLPRQPMVAHHRERLPDLGEVYLAYYPGPPEPLCLVMAGIDLNDPQEFRLATLFFDHLISVLEIVGYRAELEHQARTDWLTGLANHAALERVMRQPLVEGQALGLVKLTNLQTVRETEGRAVGDLLIRRFAHILRQACSPDGQAFHLGGGDFSVLILERSMAEFKQSLRQSGIDVRLGWATGQGTPAELLDLAEKQISSSEGQLRRDQDRERSLLDILLTSSQADMPPAQDLETPQRKRNISIYCGVESLRRAAAVATTYWIVEKPVQLVIDRPDGFAATCLRTAPRPMLVVTTRRSNAYLHDLMNLKPEGLLVGNVTETQLVADLQRVANGEHFYRGPQLEEDPLFPREREVLGLIAQGLGNTEIAAQLGISRKTVANYVTSLQEKLHLKSRVKLVLYYLGRLSARGPRSVARHLGCKS